jgi:CYTH domain-containing protein
MNYPRDADSVVERIRITENKGHRSYSYTLKAFVPGESFPYELHDILNQDQFIQLMSYQSGKPLKKQRTYFTWNDQYFQYDQFNQPIDQLNSGILEVRPSDEHPNILLPDFIPYTKDVTSDPWYQNNAIAERLL